MLSRRILRWRLAPPFPRPCLLSVRRWPERLSNNHYTLPPFPRPDIVDNKFVEGVKTTGVVGVESSWEGRDRSRLWFKYAAPMAVLDFHACNFVDHKMRDQSRASPRRVYIKSRGWLDLSLTIPTTFINSQTLKVYQYQWLVQSRQLASPPVVSSFVIVLNIEVDHWRWIGRQSAP